MVIHFPPQNRTVWLHRRCICKHCCNSLTKVLQNLTQPIDYFSLHPKWLNLDVSICLYHRFEHRFIAVYDNKFSVFTFNFKLKDTQQYWKIVKSLNSIECSFCDKALDSIKFLQCQTTAQLLPYLCQSHNIAQGASQPNCCPIHVSCIMSLLEMT